ncbi:hypothetical protein, partial [Acinetobacter baumannii]|uniref:hypothetical protein n=1 Tax=Acinetobacter baumannii TaxID=470 RepID=UPI002090FF4F
ALSRAGVRATFEERFTAGRMASDYLAIYRALPGLRAEPHRLRYRNGEPAGLHLVASASPT